MYSFKNDYSEGAHPNILRRLADTNDEQQDGYGEDKYSIEAKGILKSKIGNPDAALFFLSGATQSNLIVIASLLRVHEAVISARTGHIYSNETGAIEATGHRIITTETIDGKLRPSDITAILKEHTLRPHVVRPRMVYISNSTEMGTIYMKQELKELSEYCRSEDLLLFMDGARLGHALTAQNNDLSLLEIAELTDVFYIGGTKNGALLGEALIFNNPQYARDFDYVLKQRGALLAKGRLLGIQFLELFRDDLYFSLARHANVMAAKIAVAIQDLGYPFLNPCVSNQVFPILPNRIIEKLNQHYHFYTWKVIDAQHSAVRLITSWTTDVRKVNEFVRDLKMYSLEYSD